MEPAESARAERRLVAIEDVETLSADYAQRMYAIAFDLDVKLLETHYPGKTHTQGYHDIRKFLRANGFGHKQGSVYFGNQSVTAVSCVLAVQKMSREFPWINECVKDIRMLRIEENNDLSVALSKVPAPTPADSLFDDSANAA